MEETTPIRCFPLICHRSLAFRCVLSSFRNDKQLPYLVTQIRAMELLHSLHWGYFCADSTGLSLTPQSGNEWTCPSETRLHNFACDSATPCAPMLLQEQLGVVRLKYHSMESESQQSAIEITRSRKKQQLVVEVKQMLKVLLLRILHTSPIKFTRSTWRQHYPTVHRRCDACWDHSSKITVISLLHTPELSSH